MHSESVPGLHAGFSGLSIPLQRGRKGAGFTGSFFVNQGSEAHNLPEVRFRTSLTEGTYCRAAPASEGLGRGAEEGHLAENATWSGTR
jgi:hypothetical protein